MFDKNVRDRNILNVVVVLPEFSDHGKMLSEIAGRWHVDVQCIWQAKQGRF